MQNLQTTPATVTNKTSTPASVFTGNTTNTGITNFVTAPSIITTKNLPNARVEGLWVENISPWQLDNIWGYVSIVKSNATIQNI